jgi:predicted PurR-regulated permease PerM|nr:MAG: AI-2E family transporter [Bacteroidota bacterium]
MTATAPKDRWWTLFKRALLLGLAGLIAYFYSTLLFYTALSALLAYLLHPLVSRIEALGLRRSVASVLVFVVFLGTLLLLVLTVLPSIAVQFVELFELLSLDTIRSAMQTVEDYLRRRLPLEPGFLTTTVVEALQTLFSRETVTRLVSGTLGILSNVVMGLLVVPFLVFFFLKDGPYLYRYLLRLVPNAYFEMTVSTLHKIRLQMGRYLRGVLLESFLVATLAALLLTFVGLEYALAVGVLAGVANVVPYVGPLLGYLIGVAVGVLQTGDLSLTLPVLGSLVSVQIVDNVILQPWIYSRTAQLHPAVVLLAIFAAAQLAGVIGMLLAVPTITVARIIYREVRTTRPQYGAFRVEHLELEAQLSSRS